MSFLYSLLGLVVLPALTEEAREQIKNAYCELTQKSWETFFLEAFQSAFSEQKPFLQKYSDGTVELSEEELRQVLIQELQIQVDDKSVTELTSSYLLERISIAVFESEILRIGGHALSREDYLSLVSNIVKCAQVKFKQAIIQNEITFRQAIYKQMELNNEYLSEIQGFLKREFEFLFQVDKKLDGIKEETHEIKGSIAGLSKQVETIQNEIFKTGQEFTEEPNNQKEVRDFKLKEMLNESKGRCIANWMAVGVTNEIALSLYEDDAIGFPLPNLESRKISILLGDFGVGKTLTIERLIQGNILSAIQNEKAPIPIYIRAYEIMGNLQNIIMEKSRDLGDVKNIGAIVIIEKIDESGVNEAYEIIKQAREITISWESVSFVIPTRPITNDIFLVEEIIRIRGLTNGQIIELVKKITNQEISQGNIERLPQPIKDAIKRPLFALLWGNYIKSNKGQDPKSIGELLSFLVEQAIHISNRNQEESYQLLELLAVKIINCGGEYIDFREIGTARQIDKLLKSRLIEKWGNNIGFPIPIFTQWFAAYGLARGLENFSTIIDDQNQLEKWRYSLAIFLSSFPFELSFPLFSKIVLQDPGFAAIIIKDSVSSFVINENEVQINIHDCIERVKLTMQVWCEGIGLLSRFIGPINQSGKIEKLCVYIDQKIIKIGWFEDIDSGPDIALTNLSDFQHFVVEKKPHGLNIPVNPSQPCWSWFWCLNYLKSNLKEKMNSKKFILKDGWVFKEKMWRTAKNYLRLGDIYEKPIMISELKKILINRNNPVNANPNSVFSLLLEYIEKLETQNLSEFGPLWPTADIQNLENGYIWSPFTDSQIVNRTQAIFSATLEEYLLMVNSYFNCLKNRMWYILAMPARVNGNIYFVDSNFAKHMPCIEWFFDPLPYGSSTAIEINLGNKERDPKMLGSMYEKFVNMRPQYKSWISYKMHSSVLEVFTGDPLTNLVYDWIESDLKAINWFD